MQPPRICLDKIPKWKMKSHHAAAAAALWTSSDSSLFLMHSTAIFSAEEDTIKHQLGFGQFSFPSICLKREWRKESGHNSKNRPGRRVVCLETNIWSRRFALSPLASLHVPRQFILFFERFVVGEQLVTWFSEEGGCAWGAGWTGGMRWGSRGNGKHGWEQGG